MLEHVQCASSRTQPETAVYTKDAFQSNNAFL